MAIRKRRSPPHSNVAADYSDIIRETAFLDYDEVETYFKLVVAFDQALEPMDLFDRREVAEVAFRSVEIDRYQEAKVALLQYPAVLAELLALSFGDNVDRARTVALAFYGDDKEKAEVAAHLIMQSGLTSRQIRGHAIFSQLDKQIMIERLIANCADANRRVIKVLLKKKEKRAAKYDGDALLRQRNTFDEIANNNLEKGRIENGSVLPFFGKK